MKTFKEYMNIRPDSPMGATVHHYDAPKDTKGPDLSDIAPETLTILHIRQEEGPAPANPDDSNQLKYFNQQTPQMKQQIIADLNSLSDQAPDEEISRELKNFAGILQLSII